MYKDFKFDGSLKEFCVCRTRKEIRGYFTDNFLEDSDHIFANGIYYQCAIDVWFGNDDDVCTDLWIDWTKTEENRRNRR